MGEFGRLLRTHSAIAPAELSVPVGIRAVMHNRPRRLSQPCRDVLAMGAVLGEQFSAEVVARSTERDSRARLCDYRIVPWSAMRTEGSTGGDHP